MITAMMIIINTGEASFDGIPRFFSFKMIAQGVLAGIFKPMEDNLSLEPANLIRACDPNLAQCLSDILTKMSEQ